jgi:D-threo-aldose 1-dehydrogenase
MASLSKHTIRNTGVTMPALCFGTSALGNMPDTYTYEVDVKRAIETVKAIVTSDFPFLDVSRNYGMGRSEERIGLALQELGGLPEGAMISTKLDRNMDTLSFTASDARRSIEESLTALKLDRVDILHLHDPEHAAQLEPITSAGGAIDELFKMRDEGLCRVVGLAAGNVDVMLPILQQFDFDVMITHNRHTLVNANAEALIQHASDNNVAVLNAAPYCGGVLAKGSAGFQRYVYQQADAATLESVRQVEAICESHGIPPGAAALQFSLRDDRIQSTICGVSKPERVQQTIDWARHPIDDATWTQLSSVPRSSDDPEASRQYSPG